MVLIRSVLWVVVDLQVSEELAVPLYTSTVLVEEISPVSVLRLFVIVTVQITPCPPILAETLLEHWQVLLLLAIL